MSGSLDLSPNLRCPFCGSEAVGVHGVQERSMSDSALPMVYFGQCLSCGARGPRSADFRSGKASWNKRSTEQPSSEKP